MKKHLFLSSLFALAIPAVALAHAEIESSTPAEGATVSSVNTVTLNFEEAMIPATTTAQIVMTAMPSTANHDPMQIRTFTTAWSHGNKTMTMSLRNALRPGTYEVRWAGAGGDGHRMTGTVHFRVS